MQQRNRGGNESRWTRHERLYWLVKVAMVLMVPMSALSMMALAPNSHAATGGDIDGNVGVLHVQGALTESACRLEMASASQTVDLGDIGTGRLQQVGSRGKPVKVRLQLRDCLRSPADNLDERSGTVLWNPSQPAVSVSFVAPADVNAQALVQVQGASGLGLRLRDQQGRDVRLGSRGAPLWLTPGQSTLVYSVTPERTRAPLQAGAYSARVDFRLSYD